MQFRALFVGLTTIDIQYFVDAFPESNVKVKTKSPDIHVGGPATNAAVVFAKLNQGTCLASASGANAFSSFVECDFKNTGVNHFDLAKNQNINPVIASVITSTGNGDRNIFTHNPDLKHTEYSAQEIFNKVNPEILMIDGFYPEFAIECAKFAKNKNIPVVIDCGSWKPHLSELLEFVDIAICSNDFYPPACKNSNQVFEYLRNKKIKVSGISKGRDNIITSNGDEIKINNVKVTDTLGAGDFLHGAFCYYFLQTRSFKNALVKASELATKSCQYKGTRSWLKFIWQV